MQSRTPRTAGHPLVEPPIRVAAKTARELFDPLDPSPLGHRALRPEVDQWITEWARDLPTTDDLAIRISLDDNDNDNGGSETDATIEGIQNHFDVAAWLTQRRLRRHLRDGRSSLIIGLTALIVFTMSSRLLDGQNAFVDVLSEGLAILGWVSMWRPFEMFLFDWWSIRRDLRLYRRLTAAKIVVAST